MRVNIFNKLFGRDSQEFATVESIDEFVEEKRHQKLRVELYGVSVCSCRGSVHPIETINVNERLDRALS